MGLGLGLRVLRVLRDRGRVEAHRQSEGYPLGLGSGWRLRLTINAVLCTCLLTYDGGVVVGVVNRGRLRGGGGGVVRVNLVRVRGRVRVGVGFGLGLGLG